MVVEFEKLTRKEEPYRKIVLTFLPQNFRIGSYSGLLCTTYEKKAEHKKNFSMIIARYTFASERRNNREKLEKHFIG